MSNSLDRRLIALERTPAGRGVVVRAYSTQAKAEATDAPAATASVNGLVWYRAPGEAEAASLEQVGAEARPLQPGCGVVGFLA